jgi:RNase H-like domain found in reverse transcriptase
MQADIWPWAERTPIVRDRYDLDPAHVVDNYVCFKPFNALESATDSNERELMAIEYTLEACKHVLAGSVITIHSDNMNAVTICNKGSSKPRLTLYATRISRLAIDYIFRLNIVWIPRTLNNVADFISKEQDFSDYSVTDDFYNMICGDFGISPDIDLFASDTNAKAKKFFSLTFCPSTAGVNAFNYNWSHYGVGWIFVPPPMILRCLNFAQITRSEIMLLVPQWKRVHFIRFY